MFALNLLVHLLSLLLHSSSSLDEIKENIRKGPVCRDLTGIYDITQHCCVIRSNETETFHNISNDMKPKLPSITCLPTFIIAGTQKSGTTVLAALLNEHNAISFPARKELHFFDRDAYYKKGKQAYLKAFKTWTWDIFESQAELQLPLFAEATPFYLASKHSCRRIAALMPEVKLIVLMREPISRAYSEYQMKARRVNSQNEFISLVYLHDELVYDCMTIHREKWIALRHCLPYVITSHSHYSKFIAALKAHSSKTAGGWATVMSKCFARQREFTSSDAAKPLHPAASASFIQRPEPHAPDTTWPMHDIRDLMEAYSSRNVYKQSEVMQSSDYISSQYGAVFPNNSNDIQAQCTDLKQHCNALVDYGIPIYKRAGYFQPIACLGKFARENIASVTEVFLEEVNHLESCGCRVLTDIRNTVKYEQLPLSALLNISSVSHTVGESQPWPVTMTAVEAEVIVRRCVNITSGISKQFIYRSMYAPQLSTCFRHIPRENFLFLSSERMQEDPEAVARIVLRFIGFTDEADLSLTADASTYNDLVEKTFPKFEKETGWQLIGRYPKIPRVVRKSLAKFFTPFNAALYDLIYKDFVIDWGRRL